MVVTGTLRISDAAVAAGVSAHTLRYDERAGLIGAQLDEVARNVAAIDTKLEIYEERTAR